MKRFLLFLLITLTCFNLAGGYTIAATVISQASAPAQSPVQHNPNEDILKKRSLDLLQLQVSKKEAEEDNSREVHFKATPTEDAFYRYAFDFKKLNQHFLVHYAAAIKDSFPADFLLHQNFRI